MSRPLPERDTWLRPTRKERSDKDLLHLGFRVTVTRRRADRDHGRDFFHFGGRQLNTESSRVFVQALGALGARNGDDVFATPDQPGQNELCRGATFLSA